MKLCADPLSLRSSSSEDALLINDGVTRMCRWAEEQAQTDWGGVSFNIQAPPTAESQLLSAHLWPHAIRDEVMSSKCSSCSNDPSRGSHRESVQFQTSSGSINRSGSDNGGSHHQVWVWWNISNHESRTRTQLKIMKATVSHDKTKSAFQCVPLWQQIKNQLMNLLIRRWTDPSKTGCTVVQVQSGLVSLELHQDLRPSLISQGFSCVSVLHSVYNPKSCCLVVEVTRLTLTSCWTMSSLQLRILKIRTYVLTLVSNKYVIRKCVS